jgi:hypothetical protein
MTFHLLCDEQRMAERIVALENDNRALRMALQSKQDTIDAMVLQMGEIRDRHRQAVTRLTETVKEFLR